MSIAGFDRRIGFEQQGADNTNAFGEPSDGWLLLGQTMARRLDVKDAEKLAAGREISTLTARFTVRRTAITSMLTPADRLVSGGVWDGGGVLQSGTIWDIVGVKEATGSGGLEIEITAERNK